MISIPVQPEMGKFSIDSRTIIHFADQQVFIIDIKYRQESTCVFEEQRFY